MIEFMLIAAPRSGTTWAANWLTTDTTVCLHDPLYKYHYSDLDSIHSDKVMGVSCTGLANFPDWLNKHPARKVIAHRKQEEISKSLSRIGLPDVQLDLTAIEGRHVVWHELFERPQLIYEYLLQKPFDAERHSLLKDMHMQPRFETIKVSPAATRRLVNEVRSL